MTIKVSVGKNTSNAEMFLEFQESKGLIDPENILLRCTLMEDVKQEKRSERFIQEIMSRPQKKTRLFDMAGKVELDDSADMLENPTELSTDEDISITESEAAALMNRNRARLFSAEELEEAERFMQEIMSRPQKKTRLFDMAGKIELD